MDQMVNQNGMNWGGLFSGMTSGDKAFLGLVGFTGFMYFVKLIFDSVDKAMEHGYDATIASTNSGSISFTHRSAHAGDQAQGDAEEEAEYANVDYNELTV